MASVLAVALVAFGVGAGSRWATRTEKKPAPPQVLALRLSDVLRVIVESDDRRVQLTRSADGSWSGASGAPAQTEALMSDAQGRLFPLGAYRALGVDTSAPRYGLVDPEITFRVVDTRGRSRAVLLGAPTFTGGGFYARRGADPRWVYLVPRQMMDDLRSLLAGRRIDTPDEVAAKVRELTNQPAEANELSGWLQQALDAGTPLPEGLR